MYSVVNGKLMRNGATARIEVLPREAAQSLNALLAALREAQAFLRTLGDAPNQQTAHDLIVNNIEDVEDTVSAALKSAVQE